MKHFTLFNIAILLFSIARGQEDPGQIPELLEYYIENNLEAEENEPDYELLIADLENFRENPLNLNTAKAADLERFWFLTDFQIQSLIEYRNSIGQIRSVYELNYVYGFNEKTVNHLKPFVVTDQNTISGPTDKSINESHHELLMRVGYRNNKESSYKGGPFQLYCRFKGNDKDKIVYGILAEKDAGEEFLGATNNTGFDFYSGFLQINTPLPIRSIYLGDYRVRAGQGLLIWNGYSSGNPSVVSSMIKKGQGINGNASKDEYNFLRGGATEIYFRNFKLTVFASAKYIDGRLDSVNGTYGLTSINTSGYHRTHNELLNKNSSSEKIVGSTFSYKSNLVTAGINWLNTVYEHPVLPSDEPWKLQNFKGKHCSGISVDYKFLLQQFQLYGEVAQSNNSIAMLSGINFLVSTKFTGNIFYRYYPANYFTPYSGAMGTNSSPTNEQGVFLGFNWQSPWYLTVSASSDIFGFPWLSYYSDKPLHGKENMFQLNYSPGKNMEIGVRYRIVSKDKNQSLENLSIQPVSEFVKKNVRMQGWFKLNEKTEFTSRFEWCRSGYSGLSSNNGYLAFADFGYKYQNATMLSFRYTFYSISDFNSRIYTYEDDVLYSFSVPAFSGNGQKMYLMLKHQFYTNIFLWLRYELTCDFSDEAPDKHGFKGQIILKF